ncbi:MAG: hypothetical protein WCN92_09545 [Eubacteriales bacterium]
MQDRYAGDVGDFGKLGMIRQIANTGLKVGINWFLAYKPDEHDKEDGKHIGYFINSLFQGCDDELLNKLKQIVEENRSVAAIERSNFVPGARHYSAILKPGSDKTFSRDIWFRNSLDALADSDIIFCDPDNGLLVKSVSPVSSKSDKYVMENELVTYYTAGKSVVFYNHRCREKEEVYLRRFAPLRQHSVFENAECRGLKFARGTVRDYIFILQPYHYEKVNGAIESMMKTDWNRHFLPLNINQP